MPRSTTAASAAPAAVSQDPDPQREGIGLCLSGGGYRATLFHLGSVRRLHELGVMSMQAPHRFRTISSVSGGSITNAQLAVTYPWKPPGDEWTRTVAVPLREFTKKDIRTWPFLLGLLPKITTIGEIAKRYDKFLGQAKLARIPDGINFVFCATDLAFGSNFEFRRNTIGDYQLGHIPTPEGWPLGRAVAASACFPPLFQPMSLKNLPRFQGGLAEKESPKEWAEAVKDVRLTDGGNYDNMGLEPVFKHHRFVLVSDAGGVFDFESAKKLLWRIKRYQAVQETQTRYLRRRWLLAMDKAKQVEAVYWSVSSGVESYGAAVGYSKKLAVDVISNIRSDLDAFSDAESAVLQNHGYTLADAAMRKHAATLLSNAIPKLEPPFPDWMPDKTPEDKIAEALKDSSKRKIWGRR